MFPSCISIHKRVRKRGWGWGRGGGSKKSPKGREKRVSCFIFHRHSLHCIFFINWSCLYILRWLEWWGQRHSKQIELYRVAAINPEFFLPTFKWHSTAENHPIWLKLKQICIGTYRESFYFFLTPISINSSLDPGPQSLAGLHHGVPVEGPQYSFIFWIRSLVLLRDSSMTHTSDSPHTK